MSSDPHGSTRPRKAETAAGLDPAASLRVAGLVPFIPEGLDCHLVLLRHGETTYITEQRFQGRAETPLSAAGRRQAELAGSRLADPLAVPPLPFPGRRPELIVHSPLLRTRETAEIVAAAMRSRGDDPPPLRPEPGIAEIGQGEWEGLRQDEIVARYGDELAGWRVNPVLVHAAGGEALPDVQARVEVALRSLLGELAEGREPGSLDRTTVAGYPATDAETAPPWVLLVGHDGVFKVLLLTLLGLPLDHFWNFSFSLASISVIEIRGGRAILRALSLDAHLGPAFVQEAAAETAKREATGAL